MGGVMSFRKSARGLRFVLAFLIIFAQLFVLAPTPRAYAAGFTVNSTGDAPDANLGDGVCETATLGECTLRAAIEQANALAGEDVIGFALGGPSTITPGSALPVISDTLTIDGTTEAGASCAAWPPTLLVELDGSSAGGVTGLEISLSAIGSTLRGLVINNFTTGIRLDSDSSRIQCNFLGTNTAGTAALGNAVGLDLNNASDNHIGTDGDGVNDAAERNLISGNLFQGMIISGTSADNTIAGNYIGVDATGLAALPNGSETVVINGVTNTRIGTNADGVSDALERNVIIGVEAIWIIGGATGTVVAGNYVGTDAAGLVGLNGGGIGVELSGAGATRVGTNGDGVNDAAERNVLSGNGQGVWIWGSNNAVVAGNYIGVGPDGTTAVPNTTGILVNGDSTSTRIGSDNDDPAEANLIASNTGNGVEVNGTNTFGIRIVGNRMRDNGGLGIDLDADGPIPGPTPNDPQDLDSGPNNLQNYPELSNPRIIGGNLLVDVSLDSIDSVSNPPFEIHFYEADSAASGEGAVFLGLGSPPVFNGGSFTADLGNAAGLGVDAGDPIVATATDALNITSEFSPASIVGATTFVVTNTGDEADLDTGDGVCATATEGCTLRAAIQQANAVGSTSVINFAIGGPGPHTIALGSSLPLIATDLTIDGLTQDGASCAAWPPALQIEINASGSADYGLRVFSGALTLRGVVINRYPFDGIFLDGTSGGNTFECNFIGTNVAGTASLTSGQSAIFSNGADNNVFGGPSVSQRNLFSGANGSDQLRLAGSDGNTIQGNYIGTEVTGATTIAGGNNRAILITGSNNQIGGTTGTTPGGACTGACNVIAGSIGYQIWISAPGITNNVVEGNHIGVNAAGTARASLNIAGAGVQIDSGALNTIIGGTIAEARNVIGGALVGVAISGAATTGTIVQGNYIGLNSAGTAAIPNVDGVVISVDSANNTVGGTTDGAGNVISGNSSGGVEVNSAGTGNVIQGNYLGTNAAGTAARGNTRGIWILGTNGTVVGGTTAEARNLISGNSNWGVLIQGAASSNNVVQGNYIGTNALGTAAIPNGEDGVKLQGADGNTIGGTAGTTPGGPCTGACNLISGNERHGVSVEVDTATDNIVRGNAIYDNGGIGIDLGVDGVTFNHQGVIAGPNRYQNYPVISVATTNGTQLRLAGALVAQGGQLFDIDVYANPTCDPSFFGEGQVYLGSFTMGTSDGGEGSFDQTFAVNVAEPTGVSMVATGPDGSSEFSYCRPVTTNNLTWLDALELGLDPVSAGSIGDSAQQRILDRYQEKWFKFPVNPGDTVHVTLTGQPGSGITLHRDPTSFYNGLTNPPSAAVLSAAAADTAFLPSQSLPSQSLPSQSLPSQSLPTDALLIGYLPSQSLPSQSLPSQSLPSQSLPSQSLPSQSLPSQSLPSQSLPTGSLPSQSLPSQSLPSQSLPSQSLPSQSLPEAYSGAARRSLMAAALDPYATTQTIDRTVYDLQEDLYVRVIGPYDPLNPFTLDVTVDLGVCGSLEQVPDTLSVVAGGGPAPGSFQTFILTDRGRLSGSATEIAAALSKLGALAARADVDGLVIDLGATLTGGAPRYPRVEWANEQADQFPVCPSAKNMVAREIKAVIDAHQAVNGAPLDYIVLAGGADVIPFFQVADLSGLASEKEYVPPVRPETSSEAGLRVGLVKGQDFYGSTVDLTIGDRVLSVPGQAVGRLVETAADISAIVDNYIASGGAVTPQSSLVTGYDFVGDAAAVIRDELASGTTPPDGTPSIDTLIQPVGESPSGPNAWTADELRAKLYNGSFDIAVLTGHFSAGNLLAADYRTTLSAAEVAASPADLSDVLILALGCHGGFSIPSSDLLASGSPDPDWAKAFLRKGVAGYVAATGYAYGDTELTEYGERLFVGLSRQLRTGSGPVALGQALVAAKQRYLAETAQLSGIDEKTVVEMTLYGLPMMKIDMPGERIDPDGEASIVTTTTAVDDGPGAQIGLRVGQPTSGAVVLNTDPEGVVLPNLDGGGDVNTTYLVGDDGVVANPFEPILPKDLFNVSVSGLVLRGIGFRGGSYEDLANIVPLTTAPATETSRANQSFETDTFYPGQVLLTNHYDALVGGPTRLIAVPAQYKSRAPGAIDGTLRVYSSMRLALYYLPESWQDDATARAAVVAQAPTILAASGKAENGAVTFTVNALGDGASGVQAVWVVYTSRNAGDPLYGEWQALDLSPTNVDLDPTLWQGGLTLPVGADPEEMLFMVQAVSAAGLTTLATNLGAYYPVTLAGQPEPTPAPSSISLALAPSTGTYLRDSTFRVLLTSGGQPLSGFPLLLSLGGLTAQATTDGSGAASFTLRPILAPGDYTVQATFRGTDEYESSTASAPFTIARESTSVELSPPSATAAPGAETPFVATLRDGTGRGLSFKSVVFVVSGGQTLTRAVNTDFWGNAALGAVDLPAGSYTVAAYFGGPVPLGGGETLELSDDYYVGSSDTGGSLTITAQSTDTTPPVIAPTVTGTLGQNGWYTSNVTVSWSVTDAESAIDSSGGCATTTISADTAGTTLTCTATSAGGTASASVTVKRDATAPNTTITGQPDNPTTSKTASFSFQSSETGGTFQCKLDTGAYQTCASPKGYSNLALGSHTFSVRASDAAGNVDQSPATYTWTVRNPYPFSGFLAPVKSPPQLNRVKAGRIVPVRFTIGGNQGLNIFAPGYPKVVPINCGTRQPVDINVDLDPTERSATTSLIYNRITGRYIYLWRTDTAWANTCQQLVLKFNDGGPEYVADFRFVR